jgi:hypothetical protein
MALTVKLRSRQDLLRLTKMADIQIAIAGQNSIAATEALMAIPGVTGTWQADESARRDGGVTATIATVVGIVGGSMAIAEQIRKWYLEYRDGKSSEKTIEKVLIVGKNGRRLLLEDATLEEIRQILED